VGTGGKLRSLAGIWARRRPVAARAQSLQDAGL
jgi:hypothetical protein